MLQQLNNWKVKVLWFLIFFYVWKNICKDIDVRKHLTFCVKCIQPQFKDQKWIKSIKQNQLIYITKNLGSVQKLY